MLEDLKLINPGEIRVRVAPSPTGGFHIGTARTALFNYIFAKKYQGIFVLRIEDTDIERSEEKYEKDIIEGLKWLGIDYNEGPDCDGPFAPYRQSERKDIYKKYIEKLLSEGKLYRCFCSLEELEAHRQYLLSIGQPPRYSEKCRELKPKEIEENLKEGKPYVLRFKTPAQKIIFHDILRGKIEYDSTTFGDIVVAKNTEIPLYNLAVVIDDFEMKITHVIRGEDHIPNTPKQIVLAEALGFEIPKFLHLPLILGQDRAKLSKRSGQTETLADYKKQGYLPEAITNFLAFLGWNPGTDREIFSLASLVQEFSVEKLQKSGAIFNPQKLDWLNSFYIKQKSKERFTELCLPFLLDSGLIEPMESQSLAWDKFKTKKTGEEINLNYIQAAVSLYQERIKKFSEIPDLVDFFFKEDFECPAELLKWKDMDNKDIKNSLEKTKKTLERIKDSEWTKENLEKILMDLADKGETGDRGAVLWPLRACLSGKKASAGPFEIAEVLGKEKTIKRIKKTVDNL